MTKRNNTIGHLFKQIFEKEAREKASTEEKDSGGSSRSQSGRRSSKKHPLSTIAKVLGIALVAILLIGYVIFRHFYSKLDYNPGLNEDDIEAAIEQSDPADYRIPDEVDEDSEEILPEAPPTFEEELRAQVESYGGSVLTDKDVTNILLIGTDSRTNKMQSRSDTMILLSANRNTRQITITSFMRDVYTYIPDLGWSNRLNVPCAVGGPTMLMSTIEQVFGIEVDNYVMVNFLAFKDIINVLGGVDVEVGDNEIWYLNANIEDQNNILGQKINSDKLSYDDFGLKHLNGNQALAYCRIRKLGGDTGRTERQRRVINTLIEQASNLSVKELYDLMNMVLPYVTTDLTQADCLSLLANAPDYLKYERQTLRIPHDGDEYYGVMIDGMSVTKIDFDQARATLKKYIYNIAE